MSATGCTSANFHEANRSEYLAHYVLSSFGTSVPVPRAEDTGLDLYCTLTERVGQRIWPRHYYSVQVKSTAEPWKFEGEESVRWLIEHPLPIFLCVVDKRSARIRLYHTLPRFYVWAMPPLPEWIALAPGDGDVGQCVQWQGLNLFSLSAPILDFTVMGALQDGFVAQTAQVLRHWLDIEQLNLSRMRSGLLQFTMPANYRTNSCELNAWATQGRGKAPLEHTDRAILGLKELLGWLANQRYEHGDEAGAVRLAMLFRHYFPRETPIECCHFFRDVNKVMGADSYMAAGVDRLNKLLTEAIAARPPVSLPGREVPLHYGFAPPAEGGPADEARGKKGKNRSADQGGTAEGPLPDMRGTRP